MLAERAMDFGSRRRAAVVFEDGALAPTSSGPPDVPVIGVTRGDLQRHFLASAADHQARDNGRCTGFGASGASLSW